MRILILGGTTEGSALATALAGERPVLSLAGRTRAPVLPGGLVRRGGFGGVAGLAAYLRDEGVDVLIDATHPFARVMHGHAAAAAELAGVRRVVVSRPGWVAGVGDRWTLVADMAGAVAALGAVPRRVFLTVGQQELAPFRAAPWHEYLVRSIEPPDPELLPPRVRCIAARGPFDVAGERALLEREGIEVVVSKNSGGEATVAKLVAARDLGVAVVMVERPEPPAPPVVADVAGALAWLRDHAALRGV